MKVIIEDLVAKMAGGKEKILPKGTTIRFEMGNTSLSCSITEDGLAIYKINNTIEEDRIITIGCASNKLYIK